MNELGIAEAVRELVKEAEELRSENEELKKQLMETQMQLNVALGKAVTIQKLGRQYLQTGFNQD